ncbi:MAG: hypothetical protein M3068_06825 [Gemmatimonadota bacterium]|nr:hypothetical protein [Gemmatimonadota bacterium]
MPDPSALRGRRPLSGKAAARRGRLFLVALFCLAARAGAQPRRPATSPTSQTDVRVVEGRVVRPHAKSVEPVPSQRVVLHRVAADAQGPIDSVLTGADGRFRFRYRVREGGDSALYILTARHHGIAYISMPLRQAIVKGDEAEIAIFDTTSGPLPIRVRGRHIVLSAADVDGVRELAEVFELSNDSSVTRISTDGRQPVWSTSVPRGAADLRIGQSDAPAEAMALAAGRVTIVAPFAPGIKQISFALHLPSSAFPLTLPLEQDTPVLELLLEEAAARVEGFPLVNRGSVSQEGRVFQRWLATDAPARTTLRISVPSVPARRTRQLAVQLLVLVLGTLMIVALGFSFARRPERLAFGQRSRRGPVAPETLARAVAELDRRFEGVSAPSAAERAEYAERRDELKQQLARALDAARPPR